ncbi:ABC transporter substrate-binding protein [Nitratireductor pacificus]|uniref:Periplasmic binding protein n=1 Tax=Nitratireductor pacificus pht-3B TaxID=391937 RepID=K2N8V0_9HYPH|nr:ABC transporter substrate-binding protein [Nitratireductor pacificus]EKF20533.1 periplasmic binding protein [Nitratireductor pacificus pht-3B]
MVGHRPEARGHACVGRRTFLSALAALACGTSAARAGPPAPRRIVALDAPSTEMLVTLGMEPLGVAGLEGYRQAEGDIAALRNSVDVGFFYEPNLELLQFLKPDLFVSSFGIGAPAVLLQRIAPVLSAPIYGGSGSSHEAAAGALRRIAGEMGRRDEAETFLAGHEKRLSTVEEKMRPRHLRPVYLASPLLDGRHAILYGRNSLFDDVLRRVGMRNAFDGQSSPWGVANLGIGRLADEREAVFLYIESPVTETALKALDESAIWKTLPFVKEKRVVSIPYLEMYGALPTADRFAGILESLLDRGALDAG